MEMPFTRLYENLPLVEVTEEVVAREFTNKQTGQRERNGFNQSGYLIRHDDRGRRLDSMCRVAINRDASPYAPGVYLLAGMSLRTLQYGDLDLDRYNIKLVPIPRELIGLIEQEEKRAA